MSIAVEVPSGDTDDSAMAKRSSLRATARAVAVKRLSAVELEGLQVALDLLDSLEHTLIINMTKVQQAATKERMIRSQNGLPPNGSFSAGHSAMLRLLYSIETAREETHMRRQYDQERPPPVSRGPRKRQNINN